MDTATYEGIVVPKTALFGANKKKAFVLPDFEARALD